MTSTLMDNWSKYKPVAIAFAAGLLVGPFVSNYAGWQVTSRTALAEVSAGIIEQQALFCAARARADVAAPEALGWEARYDLAKKWSTMPGSTTPAAGVASACASKLAV